MPDARQVGDLGELSSQLSMAPTELGSLTAFALTLDIGNARRAASRRVEDANPELDIKRKKSAEERLSIAFAERARKGRIKGLDRLIGELRRQIKPA